MFFPPGVYNVNGIVGGAIPIEGVNNACIYGEDATIFLDTTTTLQPRVLRVENSTNVEIHSLSFDGNRNIIAPQTSNELSHSIELRGVDGFWIHDIVSREQHGDGINVSSVTNGLIERNDIDDNNRNGITFGFHGAGPSNAVDIVVRDNTLGGGINAQQVDIEDNNASNIYILDNTFVEMLPEAVLDNQYAVAVAQSAINTVNDIYIRGNSMDNGIVIEGGSSNVQIWDNTRIESIVIWNGSENIYVFNNQFEHQNPTTGTFRNPNFAGVRVWSDGPGTDISDNIYFINNEHTGSVGDWLFEIEDTSSMHIVDSDLSISGSLGQVRVFADNVDTSANLFNNTGQQAVSEFQDAGLSTTVESFDVQLPIIPDARTSDQIVCDELN